ncbi:molybdopterin-dependent oxidoreductase [Adlercreutzia sp. ZJ473]|uniref:molybdopterin-containing oxidoreductase family protein n=1 Tax=Adlercreutzia sp. ZJ473 TaxID=2722822 RepID=UPI0015532370|nr:molybdopterin-dependent oxidoreductase [Adlercreutzia sp. ZJ473]
MRRAQKASGRQAADACEGKVIRSVCGGCHNCCPIMVKVENNRVVQVEGVPGDPRTGGALCAKGQAGPQIAHDPRRLMYPVRRAGERGEGKWKRVSWDDAIAELAGKIKAALEEQGPRSVGFIRGQAPGWGFTYDMTQRVAHAVGTDVGMGASECFVPRAVMEGTTYGGMPSHCDYDNADLLIFWGKQPAFSVAPSLRKIYDAHERGARLVCIDPLRFHLGATADVLLQPEPGTDLALMLAMIYVIVDRGLWDSEFVDAYTNDPGLKRLSAHVRGENNQGVPYTPQWAEDITGVPAADIEALAVEYATTKRAGIVSGHGLEGRVNVSQTTRALCILRIITGHLDRVGCDVFTPKSPDRDPNFTLIDHMVEGFEPTHPTKMFHVPPYNHPDSSWPLLFSGQGLIPTPDMYRLMREGQLKVAVFQGANIMVTQPQPGVTRAAMANVDFICAIDPYLCETAQLADLVLPAATYLERTEPEWFKSDVWLPILTFRQKCVQVGEALPDTQIMIKLGRALGFEEEFPTEDIDYYIDADLRPSGITAEQLRKNPSGIAFADIEYEKFKTAGFRAPGGKANIYGEVLEANGFDPLPSWIEPVESPRARPDVARDYPCVVFTGRSGPMYVHEQRRTIPWLREMQPEAYLWINGAWAREQGIEDGELVEVSSPRGSIRIKAELTSVLKPGWLYVPGGWAEQNYNELGIDDELDPISSQANYTMCLGRVDKIGADEADAKGTVR